MVNGSTFSCAGYLKVGSITIFPDARLLVDVFMLEEVFGDQEASGMTISERVKDFYF